MMTMSCVKSNKQLSSLYNATEFGCVTVLIWTPYEFFLNQGEIINTIILNISTCCGDVIIGPLNWGDAATVAVAQLVLVCSMCCAC
jgi:hypothetical protein